MDSLTFTSEGALAGDRMFRIKRTNSTSDDLGIIGKTSKDGLLFQVRISYQMIDGDLHISINDSESLDLNRQRSLIEDLLGSYLDESIYLEASLSEGLSDTVVYGLRDGKSLPEIRPTIHVITIESIRALMSHYKGLGIDLGDEEKVIRRFRPNMVISGESSEPFWEDTLFGQNGPGILKAGAVDLYPVKLCERCPVPTRDPDTGMEAREFMKHWRKFREPFLERNLPGFMNSKRSNSSKKRGNNYFGFFVSVNGVSTKDQSAERLLSDNAISIGDQVSIIPIQ